MLLLAAVTLFAGCAPPGVRALFRGQKLLQEGQFQRAVEEFRSAAILLGNTNAQAFNYLGLACHQAGLNIEAERAYQRAIALNPDLAEARYNLGCLLLSENRLEQAKAELTAYTLRRGKVPEGWCQLAMAQLRCREFGSAEKSFAEVLRLTPQDPQALTGMGLLRLQHNHSPREAVDYFAKALKSQPDYAPALLNLAIVAQENLNEPALALRTYRQYLNLKPPRENELAVRATVRQLEQELAPAAPAGVSNPEPRLPPGNVRPGITNNSRGNLTNNTRLSLTDSARSTNSQKLASPDTPRPLTAPKIEPISSATKLPATNVSHLASTAAPATDFEVVRVPAEPALKTAEDPAALPTTPPSGDDALAAAPKPAPVTASAKPAKRGFLQKINPMNLFAGDGKQGAAPTANVAAASSGTAGSSKPGKAETELPGVPSGAFPRYTYGATAPLNPGNRSEAERLFNQGVRAQQAQDLTAAVVAYRKATENDPSFFEAHYNLGLAAYRQGNLQTALTAYQNALAIQPDSEDARYNFALALKQANYPIDAAIQLERLVSSHPGSGRAQLALGNLYAQQLQQPSKARAHYRKVLEIDPRNPQAAAVNDWLTAHPR